MDARVRDQNENARGELAADLENSESCYTFAFFLQ